MKFLPKSKNKWNYQEDALKWLQSISGEVDAKRTHGRAEVMVAFGRWGETRLSITAGGDSIEKAARRCAVKVDRVMRSGTVEINPNGFSPALTERNG